MLMEKVEYDRYIVPSPRGVKGWTADPFLLPTRRSVEAALVKPQYCTVFMRVLLPLYRALLTGNIASSRRFTAVLIS